MNFIGGLEFIYSVYICGINETWIGTALGEKGVFKLLCMDLRRPFDNGMNQNTRELKIMCK